MSKVAVLGAGGRIARLAIPILIDQGNELTLFARRTPTPIQGVRVVSGDAGDLTDVRQVVAGQDVVYANLAGDIDEQAATIVEAMTMEGVHRLIFITALGIYDELPEPFRTWNRDMIGSATLATYRRAADAVEESNLEYTIVRPAWLTDGGETDYETTGRNEEFKGTEVSRRGVAAFVAEAVGHPEQWSRANVGISRPGTAGNKPSFY